MNVELLERVKQMILDEPRKIDMWTYGEGAKSRRHILEAEGKSVPPSEPPCKTVGCIAGWTCMIDLKDPRRAIRRRGAWTFIEDARAKLGIGPDGAEILFYPTSWPFDLRRELDALVPGTIGYAQVVARRIDRFIQTNGRE